MGFLMILIINIAFFSGVVLKFNNPIEIIEYVLLGIVLIISAFTDIESMDIYVEINIFAGIIAIIINLLCKGSIFYMLIGFLIGFLPMFVLSFFGAVGQGDAYLLAMIGVFLGWKLTLLTLFLSVVIGGIGAAILLFVFKYDRKKHIAFGPYICFAAVLALFWGQHIINWYLNYAGISL